MVFTPFIVVLNVLCHCEISNEYQTAAVAVYRIKFLFKFNTVYSFMQYTELSFSLCKNFSVALGAGKIELLYDFTKEENATTVWILLVFNRFLYTH